MIYALIITDPHETSVSLHTCEGDAKEALKNFLLDTYLAIQHSSYEGLDVEPSLDYLLVYFDEITYQIIPTKLPGE